jgi:hypothetical protein
MGTFFIELAERDCRKVKICYLRDKTPKTETVKCGLFKWCLKAIKMEKDFKKRHKETPNDN